MRIVVSAIALVACTSLASAADLGGPSYGGSLKDDYVAPAYNWTGLYVGGHVGYGWGDADHRQTSGGMPPGPFNYDVDGAFGGGTLGYNLQLDRVVVGIEGDIGYMDVTGSGRIDSSVPNHYQALELDGGLYGDITARLGFVLGKTLIYGKGGWAYYDGEATQTTTKPGFVTHGSDSFDGWVYGGGIEHMISPNLSLKVEYLRFDFDKVTGDQTSISDEPIGFVYTNSTELEVDTIKIGVNYKFGN